MKDEKWESNADGSGLEFLRAGDAKTSKPPVPLEERALAELRKRDVLEERLGILDAQLDELWTGAPSSAQKMLDVLNGIWDTLDAVQEANDYLAILARRIVGNE